MPRGRKSIIFCISAWEKKMRFFVPVEPEEKKVTGFSTSLCDVHSRL